MKPLYYLYIAIAIGAWIWIIWEYKNAPFNNDED